LRALLVLAVVAIASCTATPPQAASTPSPASSSPVALNPADSKAADLRTRLDLLLGEHVMIIAKESSAAARPDEYTSYLRLLTSNSNDLTELMRTGLGDTAATQFDRIWSAQNDYLVNYTIGLATHNKGKADGAMTNLVGKFVPQFSQFVATAAQIPLDPIEQLATQHVLETKAMIDDQFAQNYQGMYKDLRIIYTQATRIGDSLAPRIAQKFPDKFPGDASSQAVDLRATMNNLLQEHLYLATMTTSAAAHGRREEQAAAATALADNTRALGTLLSDLFGSSAGAQFDQIFAMKNIALIAYASGSTTSAKQNALNQMTDVFVTQFSAFVQSSTGLASGALRPALEAQVKATITVVDDQRSNSPAGLGADDRFAGAAMEGVADLIAGAILTKLHSRFGA
jgi:hypothetical protein